MKPARMPATPPRFLLLALVLLLAACSSVPRAPLPVRAQDHTAPLLQHPQFRAASIAAPDFVNAALLTITRLETDLASAGRP